MTRPDFERLRYNARTIFEGAGEVATLRQWIGQTTGAGPFGVQNQNLFTTTTITGCFAKFAPHKKQMPGGQFQLSELYVTLPMQLDARDEIIWEGSAYRLDGNPDHETIGAGHVLWNHPLKLANVTG